MLYHCDENSLKIIRETIQAVLDNQPMMVPMINATGRLHSAQGQAVSLNPNIQRVYNKEFYIL